MPVEGEVAAAEQEAEAPKSSSSRWDPLKRLGLALPGIVVAVVVSFIASATGSKLGRAAKTIPGLALPSLLFSVYIVIWPYPQLV